MDLNKPITLPGRGKDAKKGDAASSGTSLLPHGKDVYPTKTSINLMVDEAQVKGNTVYTILAFVAAVILIGIFCKFCVIDPLAGAAVSGSQVSQKEQQLEQLKEANASYADVSSEYERYVVKGLSDEEASQVQRAEVFDLIDKYFKGVGYISAISLSSNTLTVTMLGGNMSDVSGIVAKLQSDEHVSHVTVSTAQGKNVKAKSATISVIFNGSVQTDADSAQGGE